MSQQSYLALFATCILAGVLGSVHGFSVFLVFLENDFGVSRAEASLTYSLALVLLTIAVLYGHRFYGKASPPTFAASVCFLAAAGLGVAALAPNMIVVWIGYSLIFGGANGLGYGYALQLAGQATPNNRGFAMGMVTAAYGVGAATSPLFFTYFTTLGGFSAALIALAIVLLIVAPVVALLLHRSNIRFQLDEIDGSTPSSATSVQTILFWIAYGAGVTSGLMAIGHAAPIALSIGLPSSTAVIAPVLISACGIPGAILGGALVDRIKPLLILVFLPILSAVALFIASSSTSIAPLYACLAVIGFVYGSIIAIYPAVISRSFGAINGIKVYGRVFTAWGSAGLAAPWFAGFLYDLNGNYHQALLIAAGIAVISSATALTLKIPSN